MSTTHEEVHLNQSLWLDDWYVIEDARGCRISDADVEGTLAEMVTIAEAIESRGRVSHKRCAIWRDDDRFGLMSPRNSQREAFITEAAADGLAKQIRARVAALKTLAQAEGDEPEEGGASHG